MDIQQAVGLAAQKRNCAFVSIENIDEELKIGKRHCAKILLQAYKDGILRKRQNKFALGGKSAVIQQWKTKDGKCFDWNSNAQIQKSFDNNDDYCVLNDNSFIDFKNMMVYNASKACTSPLITTLQGQILDSELTKFLAQQGRFRKFRTLKVNSAVPRPGARLLFHGTTSKNAHSIMKNGFDASLRTGQQYGVGEYFTSCLDVAQRYGDHVVVTEVTGAINCVKNIYRCSNTKKEVPRALLRLNS
jgi:hypothetical protein